MKAEMKVMGFEKSRQSEYDVNGDSKNRMNNSQKLLLMTKRPDAISIGRE